MRPLATAGISRRPPEEIPTPGRDSTRATMSETRCASSVGALE